MNVIDTGDFCPEAVIVGGGDYPRHPLPLRMLHAARYVVCCDGATFAYTEHEGCRPWRVVGDGDSLSIDYKTLNADIVRIVREQEDNDQTKAVRYCLQHGLRRIALVGATGGREDHTLGNISLCLEYMHWGLDVRIYTDHGVFVPCNGDVTCRMRVPRDYKMPDYDGNGSVTEACEDPSRSKSQQLSVFNFSAHDMSAVGLKYPLRDFTSWWQGTLNEATAETVSIHGDGDFMIYICY